MEISLEFVPKGPIDNFAASVQVMPLRQTGDKPLPVPLLTQFTDAYMQYWRGGGGGGGVTSEIKWPPLYRRHVLHEKLVF